MRSKPTPANAHDAVAQAIEAGQLPALDGSIGCVDCGKAASMYDHRDYAKPLEVEPVCARCNSKRGQAPNQTQVTITLRTTLDFLNQIRDAAKNDRRTISNYIINVLKGHLSHHA